MLNCQQCLSFTNLSALRTTILTFMFLSPPLYEKTMSLLQVFYFGSIMLYYAQLATISDKTSCPHIRTNLCKLNNTLLKWIKI